MELPSKSEKVKKLIIQATLAHQKDIACHLYWAAIRTYVFNTLEFNDVSFNSTESALTKFIELADDELAISVNSSYSIGIMTGWDHSYTEENGLLEGLEVIKETAMRLQLIEPKRVLDLEKLRNILYENSYNLYAKTRKYKLIISGLTFILLLIFTFLPFFMGDLGVVDEILSILALGTAVLLYVRLYHINKKSKNLYTSAEQIRQFLFLQNIYSEIFKAEQIGSVLSNIDKDFIATATVERQKDVKDNYISVATDPVIKLVDNLLENTCFTFILHKRFAKRIYKDLLIIFFTCGLLTTLLLLTSILLIYFTEINTLAVLPRILIALVAVVFALDYFSYYNSFNEKSHAIEVIYNKVKTLKTNPNALNALSIFDYYNSILWDAYPMKTKFFFQHVGQINELVSMQLNEKS